MAPELIIPTSQHCPGRVEYRGSGIFNKIKTQFQKFNLIDRAKESPFGQFWRASTLTFSSVLFHQLMLHKMKVDFEKAEEVCFYVGRNETKFGVVEFALITGLNFSQGSTEDEKSAYSRSDRLLNLYFNKSKSIKLDQLQDQFLRCETPEDVYRLGLCLFVEAVLLGRESNVHISTYILKFVEDLEFFFKIPWGKLSFAKLMKTLQKDLVKQFDKKLSQNVQREYRYTAYGFAPALQYWAYEVILEVGKNYSFNHGINFPRMLSWSSKDEVGKKDFATLFSKRVRVFLLCCKYIFFVSFY